VTRLLELLCGGLRAITNRACLAAGWALIALSVVIALNVLARKIFSFSLQGVDEYGGYCLAICASIGFSQAAYDRAHIRISVLTDLLPQRLRACSDVFALALLTSVALTLAVKATGVAYDSYSMQALATSALRTPLAIPQAMWAAALCWFGLVLATQLLHSLLLLARRDWGGINRNYGNPSVDEEVAEELRSANERMAGKLEGAH